MVATTKGNASPASAILNRDWFWGLLLMAAVFLAYQPVWSAGYVWDDDGRLTANPCIVGPLGLKEIWTTKEADLCPLVYTTFWVEHALWGLAPLPYHLVNVFLHGTCGILLWRVLGRLQVPGAWLGGALWALHPVQVETAAWITEMKNTQSGVFYLLTILFYLRGLKAGANDERKGDYRNYGLALLFAALALASKSSTVILPIVLGLCAWWIEGRWQWRHLFRLAPVALMAIFPSLLTLWTQKLLVQGAEDMQYTRSLPERVATAGDAVWFYLGKLVWPHPLIFIYPRWHIDAASWLSWLPLAAVIIVLAVLWIYRNAWARPYFFAFAYFLAALLPVLGLIDGFFWRYSLVGDHFQYLASMGPLALAGAGVAQCGRFAIPGKLPLPFILGAGGLLLLGVLSWQRAWVYQNVNTLWSDTLAQNPQCWLAYEDLSIELVHEHRFDAALGQAQKAVQLKPNDSEPHVNLGAIYLDQEQWDPAIAQFQEALEINPRLAKTHNNLGNALAQKGRVDDAIAQYQSAVEIDPGFAEAHFNLGIAFTQKGRVDEAIDQFQQDIALEPYNADSHFNLANALAQKGRVDEAIDQYQQALVLEPDNGDIHTNLGAVLIQKRRLDEAIVQLEEVVRLKPGDADAQRNLAKALQARGSK